MTSTAAKSDWYRQPIAWLGIAFFSFVLTGCAWILMLAARFPDEALPVAGEQAFKMPATHQPKTP